jgi:hypothetical protein
MRFLDADSSNKQNRGRAFPLTAFRGCFLVSENLAGVKGPDSLIDTGCNSDGWLTPTLFQQWTNQVKPPGNGMASCPNSVLGGNVYTNVSLNSDGTFNGIGLQFLARHLVTFDFPRRTMYLQRTSVGPLIDEDSKEAVNFLNRLKGKGQLPGWSKDDKGQMYPGAYVASHILSLKKDGDPTFYFYMVVRSSKENSWRLQKAWRTDQNNKTIEEFSIP